MSNEPPIDFHSDEGEFRRQWAAPRVKRLRAGEAELRTNQNTDMEGMS